MRPEGAGRRGARVALASSIFGALVRARDRAYATGRLGVARLPRPVLSIGNLRVGGSGKTPAVIALGLELQRQGLRLDVLSRGYRRASSKLAIAETGEEDVAQVGDEPKLIAARLHAPVLVHPDRFRAGLEGERRFQSQLHLLDDGFQHRQLFRNFDLVLLAPGDLEDRLLPSGRLREPIRALARAHAVLWVGDEASFAAAQPRLAALTPAKLFRGEKVAQPPLAGAALPPVGLWLGFARRQRTPALAHGVSELPRGARPLDEIPSRPVAFCGLARPESFWATLAELGIVPVARRTFRDHHHYSVRDVARLHACAKDAGADGFITTAKDAVNLTAPLPNLHVVEIAMHIPALAELTAMMREACAL